MPIERSDYVIPQGPGMSLPRHTTKAIDGGINVAFPAAFINKAALQEAGVDVEQLLSVKTDTPMTEEDEAQYQKLLGEAQKTQKVKPMSRMDTAISLLRKFHTLFNPEGLNEDILDSQFAEMQEAFLEDSEDSEELKAEIESSLEELQVEVARFLEDEHLLARIGTPGQEDLKLPPAALLSALYEPAPEAEVAQQQSRKEREDSLARSLSLAPLPRKKGWARYIWPDQGIPVEGGLDPDGSSDKGMGWFQRSKDRLYRVSTTGTWDVSVLNEETLIYHIVLKGTWDQETPEDFPE